MDVGEFLPLHITGRPNFWRRDLGRDPAYQAYFGGVTPQGGAEDIGKKTQAEGGWDLLLPTYGERYAGSWVGRYVDLHLQMPEYGHTIHHEAKYYGHLPEIRSETGIVGSQEVVGSGGTVINRLMGGGR